MSWHSSNYDHAGRRRVSYCTSTASSRRASAELRARAPMMRQNTFDTLYDRLHSLSIDPSPSSMATLTSREQLCEIPEELSLHPQTREELRKPLKSQMPRKNPRYSAPSSDPAQEGSDGSLATQNSLASHTVRDLDAFLEDGSGTEQEQQPDSEDSESVLTSQSREPQQAGEPVRETLALPLPMRSLDRSVPEFKPSQSFDPDYQFGHHQWGS